MSPNSYKSPIQIPQGITDPDGQIGYFSIDNGGIEAIELLTGNTVWTTTIIAKPLIVWNDSLIAFRHLAAGTTSIQIIVFDSKGDILPVFSSDPIKFPESVRINEPDDLFSLKVYLEQDVLKLVWSVPKLYRGGIAPNSKMIGQSKKTEGGQVIIELKTGKIERISDEAPVENTVPFQDERFYEINSWEIDKKKALLLLDLTQTVPAIYLRLSNPETFQNYQQIKLAEGEGIISKLTLDCRYILIYREESEFDNFINQQSQIFVVDTGKQIAALTLESNLKDISVNIPNVYYTFEERRNAFIRLILKAKDIYSGKTLWERSLPEKRLSDAPSLRK